MRYATGSFDWPLSGGGRDGGVRPGSLPVSVGCIAAAQPDHREGAAHEHAGDEPYAGDGQRRLRDRHRFRCPVRAAAAAEADVARLRRAAGARIRDGGLGYRVRSVHRRSRSPGAVHQPLADRGATALDHRLSRNQGALDGDHLEPLHLRRSGAGSVHRGRPGFRARLAPAVLGHRGDRTDGAGALALDLRGRPAGRPQKASGSACPRAGHRRLCGRVLRRLGAAHPPVPGSRHVRAADRWAAVDRGAAGGRVSRSVRALERAAAGEHIPDDGDPGRDLRGGRVGVGGRAQWRGAGAPPLAAARGAAVPAPVWTLPSARSCSASCSAPVRCTTSSSRA